MNECINHVIEDGLWPLLHICVDLPSVPILAFGFGRAGHEQWHRAELPEFLTWLPWIHGSWLFPARPCIQRCWQRGGKDPVVGSQIGRGRDSDRPIVTNVQFELKRIVVGQSEDKEINKRFQQGFANTDVWARQWHVDQFASSQQWFCLAGWRFNFVRITDAHVDRSEIWVWFVKK